MNNTWATFLKALVLYVEAVNVVHGHYNKQHNYERQAFIA